MTIFCAQAGLPSNLTPLFCLSDMGIGDYLGLNKLLPGERTFTQLASVLSQVKENFVILL